MKTFFLYSSTIIMAGAFVCTNSAQATVAVKQGDSELERHSLFRKMSNATKAAQSGTPARVDRSSLKKLPKVSVIRDRFQNPERAPAPSVHDSLTSLPKGRVEDVRNQFEPSKSVSVPPASQPEVSPSYFSSVFGSFTNLSLSGFLDDLIPPSGNVSQVPKPLIDETPAAPQSWGSWASDLVQTSLTTLKGVFGFGEDEEQEPARPLSRLEDNAFKDVDSSSSALPESFDWISDTANWLSESIFGQPKAPPKVDPIDLDELEGLDTVHLPGYLAEILMGGIDNQDPAVVKAIQEKFDEVDSKWRHSLDLDDIGRKAEYLNGMDAVSTAFAPSRMRQRARTF